MSVSADSEENKALAELNPFRYRGYYYDNETGMYYLNSRYYNPELCRFISADGFSYISNNEKLSLNAYLYCWSNPVTFEDKEGTTPQLSLNIADIILYLKNLNAKIKESAESKIQALKDKCEGIRRNIERTLKLHYNAFIDKLEFAINNPDVVINTVLSKLLNKEVNIRFRLVEFIREKTDLYISLSKLKADIPPESSSEGGANTRAKTKSKKTESNRNNVTDTVIQAIVAAIELDCINDILNFFGSSLEELAKKSFEALKKGSLILITTFNTTIDYLMESFTLDFLIAGETSYFKYADKATNGGTPFVDVKGIDKAFGGFISFFKFVLDMNSAGTETFSKTEDMVSAAISLVTNIISIFIPFGFGLLVSGLGDIVPQIILLIKHGYIMPI